MEVLSKRDVKNLLKPFGIIYKGTGLFIKTKNKIYLASKDIQEIDLSQYNVISSGVYIGKIEKMGFRLSIEGTQILKPKQNILEIKNLDWLKGKDIKTNKKFKGFVAIKYKTSKSKKICGTKNKKFLSEDFLGSGLCSKGKIINFVPKTRRIPA